MWILIQLIAIHYVGNSWVAMFLNTVFGRAYKWVLLMIFNTDMSRTKLAQPSPSGDWQELKVRHVYGPQMISGILAGPPRAMSSHHCVGNRESRRHGQVLWLLERFQLSANDPWHSMSASNQVVGLPVLSWFIIVSDCWRWSKLLSTITDHYVPWIHNWFANWTNQPLPTILHHQSTDTQPSMNHHKSSIGHQLTINQPWIIG